MNYKVYLILFIIFFLIPGSGFAQDRHYRVEIIVLSHLEHDSEPLKSDWLRDFSGSLDFLTVPDPADEPGEQPEQELAGLELAPGELPPAVEEETDPWAAVHHIETQGELMQEVWRRLRLSAPFRPQQYLSWVQSAEEPFPLLRLHDQEIVLVDDPYADQRAEREAVEAKGNLVFSDQGEALPDDPDALPALADPTRFYRLDGTVKLRRSRFLHLDFELELRDAVYDDSLMTRAMIANEEGGAEAPLELHPDLFLVHSLKQSRQVRTGRLEYFDGPVLGVLALVTEVEIEPQPDPADVLPD